MLDVVDQKLGEKAIFLHNMSCLFGLVNGPPALHGLMEPSNIQPGGQELETKKEDGDGEV